MEISEVREALKTAILLGEAAQTSHVVEINGIGEVQIDGGNVQLKSQSGQWKLVTRKNMEKRLEELMSESFESRVKRQFGRLNFN
mgnify:CR=1 FL=1